MAVSASTNDLMGFVVQNLSIRKELHPSQKAAADRSRPSAVIAFPTSSSLHRQAGTSSYNRLSPKIASLMSFSWSNTKRATMELSSAVDGILMLEADFRRSRTLLRSASI